MEYIYIFSGHLFVAITYILSIKICLAYLKKPLRYFIILGFISIFWLLISSFLCISFNIDISKILIPFIILLFWLLYININLSIYKFLFIFLTAHCIGEIIMYLVILIDARLIANQQPSLYVIILSLLVQWGLSIPLIFGFPKNIIVTTMKKIISFKSIPYTFWKTTWILPLFIDVILFLFIPQDTKIPSINRISNLSIIVCLILSLLLIIIYLLLYKSVANFEKMLQIKDENHTLSMQTLQYNYLNDRIEDARRARHDLKQHFRAIRGYIDNNDINGIKTYLDSLEYYSPKENTIIYCKNIVLNSIFVYYLDLISHLDVELDIQINLLQNSLFETSVLTVLFGNLLENAYEALKNQTRNLRYFSFKIIEKKDNTMFIIIDNSHNNIIKVDNNNKIFSSKRKNTIGTGLDSINTIVTQLNGTINIEHDQNNFRISIFIKANK